jgi:hypothetical protein
MLRRRVVAAGGAVLALMAASLGPAVADPGDGAGWGDGDVWAQADEQNDGDGSNDSGTGGGDVSDGTALSNSSGGSSGGSSCENEAGGGLLMELMGLEGSCAYAPALGDPGVQPVNARAAAERAFDSLDLATADVHLAPDPPLPTYPNLETWIWVPASQWQPLELSVTAGATTVHVEARPVRMEIDSGERDQLKYSAAEIDPSLVCYDPGRRWKKSLGDDAETTCGYTYQTTSADNPAGGNRYRLTASIIYEGSWTCVGQCTEAGGSLGEAAGPSSSQSVDVQERQSVVVD